MVSRGSLSSFKYPFPANNSVDRKRMYDLIERFWKLNRTAVNPDTDKLSEYLSSVTDADTITSKSGEDCLTWIVPNRWNVRKGQLRQKNGKIIADFANNPLHLWTHSIPISIEINREELIKNHIYTDPNRPQEIPYHYRNGYSHDKKEWGFCLPYEIVDSLSEPSYEVEIDSDLDNHGTLKVVDAFLPGKYPDTVFVMAHTCHPALVSDGIANIAVALELYYFLRFLPDRKYSYRFIFGPEYFGAAVYLAKADVEKIKNLKFGIYLDMLSNHEPLGLQYSSQSDSRMDKVANNVITSHLVTFIERSFRGLWGNDEIFYNGPGFNIPTIGLARGMHREYHYHTDNLENINLYHMEESVWILKRIIEVFESDFIPIRQYQGPLYLSRYELYSDPVIDRNRAHQIDKIQSLIDGRHSCMDIADTLNLDFFFVRDFLSAIAKHDLLKKVKRNPVYRDQGNLPNK